MKVAKTLRRALHARRQCVMARYSVEFTPFTFNNGYNSRPEISVSVGDSKIKSIGSGNQYRTQI